MKNIPHEGLGRWMVAPWPRKEAKKAPISGTSVPPRPMVVAAAIDSVATASIPGKMAAPRVGGATEVIVSGGSQWW